MGSSTGAMESFMLTSIFPEISVCDFVFDSGEADSPDYCLVFDGNNENDSMIYDAGNPNTLVCGI